MHVLITGAGGFVGAALVRRLCAQPPILSDGSPLQLTLVDRAPAREVLAPFARWHTGGFADPSLLQALSDHPPQCVFHLASVPGSLAEREPALGVQANLLDTVALMEGLARPVRAGFAPTPRFVFASSVAVYGPLGPAPTNEDTQPQPALSYGVHKWTVELLLADYRRRRELDGCSLRLPGVVARPPLDTGHGSAFMSQIFHALRDRRMYTCPVSAQATAWWMSLDGCLDNLVHAAQLPFDRMPTSCCWQPPLLRASVQDVVQAIGAQLGIDAQTYVSYAPDMRLESIFGRYPAMHTPASEAAGFSHDGSVESMVARVIARLQAFGG